MLQLALLHLVALSLQGIKGHVYNVSNLDLFNSASSNVLVWCISFYFDCELVFGVFFLCYVNFFFNFLTSLLLTVYLERNCFASDI